MVTKDLFLHSVVNRLLILRPILGLQKPARSLRRFGRLCAIVGLLGAGFAVPAKADFLSGKAHYRDGAFVEAAAKFREGLERGESLSIYGLGLLYHQGLGVRRSQIMALDLWKHAARSGLVEAAIQIAAVYEMGRAVKRDLCLAHMWYSLAALGGSEFSARQRARLTPLLNDRQLEKSRSLQQEWVSLIEHDHAGEGIPRAKPIKD